jgi:two-component system chemotaxis sensor kinase CheA
MKVSQELLSIFVAEHREHVSRMRALLQAAADDPAAVTEAVHNELLRCAHTLKGASRAAGVAAVESLAHRLETLFSRARAGSQRLDREVIAAVHRVLDASEDATSAAASARPSMDARPILDEFDAVLVSTRAEAVPAPEPPSVRPPTDAAAVEPFDLVRVRAEDLDRLLRSSAQLLAYTLGQARISEDLNGLYRTARRLQIALDTTRRGRAETGKAAPSAGAEEDLRALARSARSIRVQQQRNEWTVEQLARRIEEDVARVRMVSAADVFDPFGKAVRDVAEHERKEVEFRAEGLNVRADRMILQALKDPILHLLRNAVAHGIERPEERRRNGKASLGRIVLRLMVRRGRLEAAVEDDGRGIDFGAVAAEAQRRGMVSAADGQSRTQQELIGYLMEPGFTTAAEVTLLSGRGMGLSVVQEQVRRLQGEVTVHSNDGRGTRVSMSVPLSVAAHHVALVSAGDQVFAIPTRGIEKVCRFRRTDVAAMQGQPVIAVDGQLVPLAMLADLLELTSSLPQPAPGEAPMIRAVLLRSGQERLAVVVDALLDERQAVVMDLGLAASEAGRAAGGAILEDGSVAIVLNAAELVAAYRQTGHRTRSITLSPEPERKQARILVVDDSITTRALEKSILEAHGFKVRVAVDGVEALELLRAEKADAVIADLMMPRMDGFGLLESMRKDADLADIPVVIVSSNERPEDQERGLALGADAYIVKRKFDQRELLETVRQIL